MNFNNKSFQPYFVVFTTLFCFFFLLFSLSGALEKTAIPKKSPPPKETPSIDNIKQRVKVFTKIEFGKDCWEGPSLKDGCLVYTSTGPENRPSCRIDVYESGKTKPQVHIYEPGREVYVCGNVVHLP